MALSPQSKPPLVERNQTLNTKLCTSWKESVIKSRTTHPLAKASIVLRGTCSQMVISTNYQTHPNYFYSRQTSQEIVVKAIAEHHPCVLLIYIMHGKHEVAFCTERGYDKRMLSVNSSHAHPTTAASLIYHAWLPIHLARSCLKLPLVISI